MEKRFVIMLQRIGVTFVAVLLLSGCTEQEEQVNKAVDDVKVALVNAIDQIQQAVSGEAGVLVDQAKDAINEVQASANTDKLIEMAGEQAVKAIEDAQDAAIDALQEGKDSAREALEQ